MAEERSYQFAGGVRVTIEKLETGFMVMGDKYGGNQIRAFSTPEGLIEWLSRELGAGPIVWALTLDIWAGNVGVIPEDILPLPDVVADPRRYQKALEDNANYLITRFADKVIKAQLPQPPPEPKFKKEKKVKYEVGAVLETDKGTEFVSLSEPKEEKPIPQGSQSPPEAGT